MKFKNWRIDTLISYLTDCKGSNILDCHLAPTCSGEITIKNGNVDVSDKIAVDIIQHAKMDAAERKDDADS